MKIIYIRETDETCDIIQRALLRIKRLLNVIKVDEVEEKTVCYLPIFENSRISKYGIKKLAKRINILLEKQGSNTVVLSQSLETNYSLKNYLYSQNINILDGRYLFKCLTQKVIEYIFKIKRRTMGLRRSFIVN